MLSGMGGAARLGAGFAVMVFLAVVLGLAGYLSLSTVCEEAEQEMAALDLDVMANTRMLLQTEFLLIGIEDKARGEELLQEHDEASVQFADSIKNIKTMNLDEEALKAVAAIEEQLVSYALSFKHLASKFHEIETDKEKLDEIGAKVDEQLAGLLHDSEATLEKLEEEGASTAK